jgi:two-component system, OmpR family, sensor kinase
MQETPPPPERVRPEAPRSPGRPGVSAYAAYTHGAPAKSRATVWRARLPIVMLLGSLLVTAAASGFIARTAHSADIARFDNAVESAYDRVGNRFSEYSTLLYATRGLFAGSVDVSAEDFRRYVDRLELGTEFPGVVGIGYSRFLNPPGPKLDSAAVFRALREGEAPVDSLWPAGQRPEYHAIVYLEPDTPQNRLALGHDMHTEPIRRSAMDQARDQGGPVASRILRLEQDAGVTAGPGFIVFMPVYAGGPTPGSVDTRRAALRGFVFAPFRPADLFTGIFGSEQQPRLAFRAYAGRAAAPAALLYASPGAERESRGLFGLRIPPVTKELNVLGQPWTLVFVPLGDAATRASNSAAVIAIALFGVLVGLVLFRVTRAEVRSREAAEASESLRGRFFAAMSHELRTPVNAVMGYNDLLLAGIYGPLTDQQENGIQRSQRAARHLLELLTDVLDLSKLEAGKMDIIAEPVRLDELLEDLLITVRPMADERKCELRMDRMDCARSVETDPRRLRQILLNLLSNATKFGAGGPVVVHCSTLPHGAPVVGPAGTRGGRRRTAGDAVVIAVTDAGPGIAPDDQQRIFEEFVQLPGTTPGGTGLGLPISRRLAELLGGTLTVESTLGRGSTFLVTLPCERRR